ncbi:MAG: hypothetical protein U0166_19905 [Acidobacteriota bacterium]
MSSSRLGCGGTPKYIVAKQAISNLVVDPVVGDNAINYGYSEWSSQRAGSCQAKRYVNIINDGKTGAAVQAAVAGMLPWAARRRTRP